MKQPKPKKNPTARRKAARKAKLKKLRRLSAGLLKLKRPGGRLG